MHVCTRHGAHLEVRGQLLEVSSPCPRPPVGSGDRSQALTVNALTGEATQLVHSAQLLQRYQKFV